MYKFCNQRAIDNDLDFLLDSQNYEELRSDTFNSITISIWS